MKIFIFLWGCSDLPLPEERQIPFSDLILVAATDFTTAFLSAMSRDGGTFYRDITHIHSDATLFTHGGDVFVVNRLGHDSILRLKPAYGYARDYELFLERRSNPHFLAFLDDTQAVVSLYDKNYLAIIDYQSGKFLDTISLAPYADADGLPESSGLYYHGGYLYLAVQRLNRHGPGIWPPVGQSYLLKIHPPTKNIVASFLLPYTNPLSPLRYHAFRNSLIFASPGRFAANYELDGGVLEFSLGAQTVSVLISENDVGEEIMDCLLYSHSLGFLISQDASFITKLYAFDPQTKQILKLMAQSQSNNGFFSDMEIHNHYLYLADRNYQKPQVRVFQLPQLQEIPTMYEGLPPFDLVYLP
ncbi:MAG: hypothetical protein NZM25_02675 [Leptospiraceae bacterium]|nr:hypothetical protein [Leptospiraceae bacterium]MDW8307173.1 hypothetical protein [Leptospiraceae bacterium]